MHSLRGGKRSVPLDIAENSSMSIPPRATGGQRTRATARVPNFVALPLRWRLVSRHFAYTCTQFAREASWLRPSSGRLRSVQLSRNLSHRGLLLVPSFLGDYRICRHRRLQTEIERQAGKRATHSQFTLLQIGSQAVAQGIVPTRSRADKRRETASDDIADAVGSTTTTSMSMRYGVGLFGGL